MVFSFVSHYFVWLPIEISAYDRLNQIFVQFYGHEWTFLIDSFAKSVYAHKQNK